MRGLTRSSGTCHTQIVCSGSWCSLASRCSSWSQSKKPRLATIYAKYWDQLPAWCGSCSGLWPCPGSPRSISSFRSDDCFSMMLMLCSVCLVTSDDSLFYGSVWNHFASAKSCADDLSGCQSRDCRSFAVWNCCTQGSMSRLASSLSALRVHCSGRYQSHSSLYSWPAAALPACLARIPSWPVSYLRKGRP